MLGSIAFFIQIADYHVMNDYVLQQISSSSDTLEV